MQAVNSKGTDQARWLTFGDAVTFNADAYIKKGNNFAIALPDYDTVNGLRGYSHGPTNYARSSTMHHHKTGEKRAIDLRYFPYPPNTGRLQRLRSNETIEIHFGESEGSNIAVEPIPT